VTIHPPEADLAGCDVAVIGGGPAGSTVAALLADSGYRVQLIEKARHPRFHIGESLLPANLRLFERLGVGDAVRDIGMMKTAAEFISPQYGDRIERFRFADAWDKSMPYAYQVRRSELDAVQELAANARAGQEAAESLVAGLEARIAALESRCAAIEAQSTRVEPPDAPLQGTA